LFSSISLLGRIFRRSPESYSADSRSQTAAESVIRASLRAGFVWASKARSSIVQSPG
jgi:hypothetical protein